MFVNHGVVGLLLLFLGGGFALITLHRKILSIQKGPNETLGRGLLSVGIAVFFSGMLTGTNLPVFPINLLFWTTAGMLTAVAAQAADSPPVARAPRGPKEMPFRTTAVTRL